MIEQVTEATPWVLAAGTALANGYQYLQNRKLKGAAHLMFALKLTKDAPAMADNYRKGRLKQCSGLTQKSMMEAYTAAIQHVVDKLIGKKK